MPTQRQTMMFGLSLLAFLLTGPAFAADGQFVHLPGHAPYFAEPQTGRRVSAYRIDLAIAADEDRSFDIPGDCTEVLQLFDTRQAYKGSIMQRRFWMKVSNDCRYHALLNQYPVREIQDFVSGFDFQNASLDILPFEPGCTPLMDNHDVTGCIPTITDPFGLQIQFPIVEPMPQQHPEGIDKPCELREGVFTGRIFADGHGLHCMPGDDAPSLRLVGVDYADINGDGFMDAILRFLPLQPGNRHRTIFLPVTRDAADGEFRIPSR